MASIVKLYNTIGTKTYASDKTEYSSASDIVAQLETAAASEEATIDFHSASPGGMVSHGAIVQNAIARINKIKEITGVVDGIAASMGYLVLLPCAKIVGYKNILIMTHGVQGSARGSAEDMRNEAAILDKFNEASAQYLSERTGLSVEVCLTTFLKSEKWWTAKEALEAKLIDEIIDEDAENVDAATQQLTYNQFISKYMKEEEKTPAQSFLASVVQHVKNALSTQGKVQAIIEKLGYPEKDFFADVIYSYQYAIRAAQYVIANGSNPEIKQEAQALIAVRLDEQNDLIKRVYGESTDATQQAENIFAERTQKLEKTVEKEVLPTEEKLQQLAAEAIAPLQNKITESEKLIKQLKAQVTELGGQPVGEPVKPISQEGNEDHTGTSTPNDKEQFITSIDRLKHSRKAQYKK